MKVIQSIRRVFGFLTLLSASSFLTPVVMAHEGHAVSGAGFHPTLHPEHLFFLAAIGAIIIVIRWINKSSK